MKQGKKLTREQKIIVSKNRLDATNWSFLQDNEDGTMKIINKKTGTVRDIKKKTK